MRVIDGFGNLNRKYRISFQSLDFLVPPLTISHLIRFERDREREGEKISTINKNAFLFRFVKNAWAEILTKSNKIYRLICVEMHKQAYEILRAWGHCFINDGDIPELAYNTHTTETKKEREQQKKNRPRKQKRKTDLFFDLFKQ